MPPPEAPGTILRADEEGIVVSCGEGALVLEVLQLEGGKALTASQLSQRAPAQFATGIRFDLPPASARLMALDVRAAAACVIGDVLGGHSLNQALPGRLDQGQRTGPGPAAATVLRHPAPGPRLQAILGQLLEKPLRDKDRDVQGLLLCGLYQLDSTRVPDHAAVAATVGATRALKKHWAKGMTNAVLRRYLREREQLAQTLDQAAAASHPPWLFQKITDTMACRTPPP